MYLILSCVSWKPGSIWRCFLFGILQRGTTGSGTSSGTPMENSQNGKYCKIYSTLPEKKIYIKRLIAEGKKY